MCYDLAFFSSTCNQIKAVPSYKIHCKGGQKNGSHAKSRASTCLAAPTSTNLMKGTSYAKWRTST